MNGVKASIHLSLLLALFASCPAMAQDGSEQDELNQFLNLLEQQTSLAIQTRLNADFVPGIVSVLNAEQMQRRGFRALWEALASLPGVRTTINNTGMRSLTMRGVETRLRLQYALEQHDLMTDLLLTDLEVTASDRSINLDPSTGLPSSSLNDSPVPVDESERRRSRSLVLQDEFRCDARTTLTSGLRFDDYENTCSNLSPRISLAWRQTDHQILKAQLARAFRLPSLIESNGSIKSSIDPETNDTLEFDHIYRDAGLVVRNTLYYSRLSDLIVFRQTTPFGNSNADSYSLRGYEVEVEKSVAHHWDLDGSLSLQDYVGDELAGAAPWMVKLVAEYELRTLTTPHLQLNSIASRDRADGDPRARFEQRNRLDFSLRRRNLLDEKLKQPASVDTYNEDYPYSAGAMLWLQIRHHS